MNTTEFKMQIANKGWFTITSSNEDSNIIRLAQELGTIINHPNGNQIDYLKPKTKSKALEGTLSFKFEHKNFPLHTDTAFWKHPARYVLLTNVNNSKTGTTILSIKQICSILSQNEISEIRKSIFFVKTPSSNFYTSVINKIKRDTYFRYDTNCMKPINKSAKNTIEILEEKINLLQIEKIKWDQSKILIFDNWTTLHGRESIIDDNNRTLKRIYIK